MKRKRLNISVPLPLAIMLGLTLLLAASLIVSLQPRRGLGQPAQAVRLGADPAPEPEKRTGYVRVPLKLPHLNGRPAAGGPAATANARLQSTPLPARLDWRDTGKVTPVKDQGYCGSCYAFAAVADIESWYLINQGTTYDFSENNTKECNWYETANFAWPGGPPGTSCDGGEYMLVADLWAKKGLVLESNDPYQDIDLEPTPAACGNGPFVKTLLDWRIIARDPVFNDTYTNLLKSYVRDYGPVFVAMHTVNVPGYNSYDGTTTLYYTGSGEVDHGVLIVGWDDSLVHAGGTGAWIVKNSYGTTWGDQGYFTIAYGSAKIGTDASFAFNFQDYDPNGSLLYWDEGGWTNSIIAPGTTAWGLVKFTPAGSTAATRVEFWTTDKTSDIDIYIWDNFNGTTLTNFLAKKENTSFNEAGYHSVQLDSPLPLTAGNDIYVAVKFANDTFPQPLAVDVRGPYATGRTWSSFTGAAGSWNDEGSFGNTIGIHLRTSVPPVAGFSASPTTVNAGQPVTFTDASTGTVASRLWSFGDGATSTEAAPSHQYTVAGVKNVSLTVTGPGGTDTKTINAYILVNPGPLDRVTASPTPVFLQTGGSQAFTASAYDQYNNVISGLDYTWSADPAAGSFAGSTFTAGGQRGTYTVQAEVAYGGATRQGTAKVAVGASMTITATLQGGARTEAGMEVPLTIRLYPAGTALTYDNILTTSPLETFRTADGNVLITQKNAATRVVTFAVGALPTDTYAVVLSSPHTLITLKSSFAISHGAILDMGTLLEGNSDDGVQITGADFSMLLTDYLATSSSDNWNSGRSDFDRDGQVNAIDFALMAANYNLTSPQTVP